jgi:flagellar biosynthesis protein FlhF
MAVHKFIGATSTDALRLVRQQLGGEAVILATRDTAQGVELIAMTPEELDELSIDRAAAQSVGATAASSSDAGMAAPALAVAPGAGTRDETATQPSVPAQPKQEPGQMNDLMSQFSQVKSLLQAHLSAKAWSDMQQNDSGRATAMRVLLNAGFSPQLCADLVERLPESLSDDEAIRQHLSADLTPRIQTLDPLALFDPGGVFAFIGPTGVGKTTAIAKIAARCVLRYGRDQMALMTTDNFRIGAQEQLKVYARILGIPFTAVQESEDFAQKLRALGQRRVVLLDTAGVSQRDIQMLEQSQLLYEGSPALKRLLVMSSTTDLRTMEDVILMHSSAVKAKNDKAIVGTIITKTDEAAQLAPVLDCLIRHQLPLVFLSNGQRVPEDLSQANTGYLLHRALHPRAIGQDLQVRDEHVAALMSDQLSNWSTQRPTP